MRMMVILPDQHLRVGVKVGAISKSRVASPRTFELALRSTKFAERNYSLAQPAKAHGQD